MNDTNVFPAYVQPFPTSDPVKWNFHLVTQYSCGWPSCLQLANEGKEQLLIIVFKMGTEVNFFSMLFTKGPTTDILLIVSL